MLRTILLAAVAAAALSGCNSRQAADATTSAANTADAARTAAADAASSAGNAASDVASTGGDNTNGPVVAAPSGPGNPPVDTTPTTGDTGQASGASSFTEGQARGALERAGYSNITGLTQNAQGQWEATATHEGRERHVSIDYRGSITNR